MTKTTEMKPYQQPLHLRSATRRRIYDRRFSVSMEIARASTGDLKSASAQIYAKELLYELLY